MKLEDLKWGDLIFWYPNEGTYGCGHIAICIRPHRDRKSIRIMQVTENIQYFAVSITKLMDYSRMRTRHYEVIRCRDKTLLSRAMQILYSWTQYKMQYDEDKYQKLIAYDDQKSISEKMVNLAERFYQVDNLFLLFKYRTLMRFSPFFLRNSINEGFMCSSAIVLAFQMAALAHLPNPTFADIARAVPSALAVDYELTSPTVFFHALLRDKQRFFYRGELPRFLYTHSENDEMKIACDRERIWQQKISSENTARYFTAKLTKCPDDRKVNFETLHQFLAKNRKSKNKCPDSKSAIDRARIARMFF